MEITGTPMSIVSIFIFAMYFATVPPPPTSTLPISPVCQITPFSSNVFLSQPINSASASFEPPFPREPVNFVIPAPQETYAELSGSLTSRKLGSYAAFTSAERHLEFARIAADDTPNDLAISSIRSVKSTHCIPVVPSLPISSFRQELP